MPDVNQLRGTYISIAAWGRGIQEGRISPVAVVEQCLQRIYALDGRLGAFRKVLAEEAVQEAQAAELMLAAGHNLGPLHGIPFAVKDLIDVRGQPTTAGTSLMADNIAHRDAWVVRRLRQAGMILLGKTNTVQFAYSGIGINHDQGTPHNPWQAQHYIPGGSSSGSGVAVAAGMVPMALGTDTGGSIRIPAALCGITGLKTTVGRVSRRGIYPLSWSLDSVGPMVGSAADARLVYGAISGYDPHDPVTLTAPTPQGMMADDNQSIDGLRLAFAESCFWDDVDPEIEKAVRQTKAVFTKLGARVTSIPFPEAEEAHALNPKGRIITAEAYSNNRKWLENHFNDLDPVVAHRMLTGKETRAWEYFELQQAWERLRIKAHTALADVDALLVPTTPIAAEPLDQVDVDLESYNAKNVLYLRNTTIGNILNLCGLSVPCGFTATGLPIGLMIYGKSFDEEAILRVGQAFQGATQWHRQHPDLSWAAAPKSR